MVVGVVVVGMVVVVVVVVVVAATALQPESVITAGLQRHNLSARKRWEKQSTNR